LRRAVPVLSALVRWIPGLAFALCEQPAEPESAGESKGAEYPRDHFPSNEYIYKEVTVRLRGCEHRTVAVLNIEELAYAAHGAGIARKQPIIETDTNWEEQGQGFR
jgi:hypothetical protein